MRSSIDLSASSVLSTNARVRSPGCSAFGDRRGRGLADRAIGRVQPREAGFERRGLAVELDRDRRDLLVEQALPRAAAGDRLLGEHDLFGLGQQVRPVAARRAQVVRGEREPFVGEQRLDLLVGELGPLELEEQQLRADHGAALVDLLHARAARGIGRVGREVEAGEAPGPADEVVHLGEARA